MVDLTWGEQELAEVAIFNTAASLAGPQVASLWTTTFKGISIFAG
jgi:hypothetical protein